ncbi:uncharacterized protein LAESUDRAFT_761122 [Laetiporus sulphureus 93-53]|uniref:Uncharacterized protein n=1 Tax=Laetiporus sulphureus 93-53 TaxID=1314785 RepID=A0A165D6R2_9APHY|nr:uncharacterized protein LAESUDRAFT_761122 [Laetiporus sulphureus 93-53]KZT04255.1 hypothetical protein LAESUDRAFT_761122 [Laetiporus sulphureus 93-53]
MGDQSEDDNVTISKMAAIDPEYIPFNGRGEKDKDQFDDHDVLLDIQHISEPAEKVKSSNDMSDVNHFFSDPWQNEHGNPSKKAIKQHVYSCQICKKRNINDFTIVADVSTLRWHLQAMHKHKYYKWCEKNTFDSKLTK